MVTSSNAPRINIRFADSNTGASICGAGMLPLTRRPAARIEAVHG